MIVGGLLIVAGLFFSSSKAQAYTAWCNHKVDQFDTTISNHRSAAPATPEHQHEEAGVEGDVCEV